MFAPLFACSSLTTPTASTPNPNGPLQWFAGSPGTVGNLDGPAAYASFGLYLTWHTDPGHGVLVTDMDMNSVREINDAGMVTTLVSNQGRPDDNHLNQPRDAVRGPDGRLYIADTENDVIRVVGNDGKLDIFAGQQGKAFASKYSDNPDDNDGPRNVATLNRPAQLAFDADGKLWVSDHFAGLRVIAKDGSISTWNPCRHKDHCTDSTIWTADKPSYARTLWLTASPNGTIWTANSDTVGRIVKGRFEVIATRQCDCAPLSGPLALLAGKVPFLGQKLDGKPRYLLPDEDIEAVAFDSKGTPYIAEEDSLLRLQPGSMRPEEIRFIKDNVNKKKTGENESDRDDTFSLTFEDGPSIAFTDDNHLLMATGNAAILSFNPATRTAPMPYAGIDPDQHQAEGKLGGKTWSVLAPGSTDFYADSTERYSTIPSAVMAPDGSVYYTEITSNSAIFQRLPDSTSRLWAGSSDEKGYVDGLREKARFNNPVGLALDATGNLYVADTGNNRIRVITPDGIVHTLAGKNNNAKQKEQDGDFAQATLLNPVLLALDASGKHLYVMSALQRADVSVRALNLETHTLNTITQITADDKVDAADEAQLEANHRSTYFTRLTVGADGKLYVPGDVVWQITPQTGARRIYFITPRIGEALKLYETALKIRADIQDGKLKGENKWKKVSAEANNAMEKLRQCNWTWCGLNGIVADKQGNLYVADTSGNTIIRIGQDGHAAVIAGQPGKRGNLPGDLPGALSHPSALSVTPAGDLLISVQQNGLMLLRDPAHAKAWQILPEAIATPTAPSQAANQNTARQQ